MARRKQQVEEHENHERWLVSYADFITLLFAFFVVMYSVSSVNEGKFRVLSDTMDAAFKDATKSMDPIQIGQQMKSLANNPTAKYAPSGIKAGLDEISDSVFENEPTDKKEEKKGGKTKGEEDGGDSPGDFTGGKGGYENAGTVMETLRQKLSPLIDEGLIEMRRQDDWVEVEMKSNTLFGSGSSRIEASAVPALEKLGTSFLRFRNPIQVEGYTDNVPINTATFPSNWELSAARAASVVHILTQFGLDPERMSAVGYGENKAVASNDTPEGRTKNRRVILIISASDDTRKVIDTRNKER